MKHTLKIGLGKPRPDDGIVRFRKIAIRERILRLLFGEMRRLTILVPGNSVETLSITEIKEGGSYGTNESVRHGD